jgi:hypothetical protein
MYLEGTLGLVAGSKWLRTGTSEGKHKNVIVWECWLD